MFERAQLQVTDSEALSKIQQQYFDTQNDIISRKRLNLSTPS
jgi:ribosome maturation factor RimP